MKLFGILAILLLASSQASAASGGGCAACTLLVSLVEQVAIDTSVPVKTAIKTICGDLSPKVKFIADICSGALELFAPQIEKDFQAGQSPDYTCHKTLPNMCKDFPTCQLYTKWPPTQQADRPAGSSAKGAAMILGALASIMNTDLKLDVTTQPQEKVKHLPIFDNDGDRFSTYPTLRGSHWRGKDCDDGHSQIYPGRATDVVGPKKDHNCNGIFGTDGQGNSYESKFCANSGQRGVVVLGDSAAAHFHIPPEWLTAKGMDNSTYANLLPVAEDEADYPACSGWTGWMNLSSCPYTPIKAMDSIYLRMRDRNRCNHRDFQNIGVNGGSTGNMAPPNGIIMSLKSRNGTDQPALVFYALIGNDVCNHHADFDHMTTPEQFETNVLSALDYLDANLAPNSYVVFISLADGRVLYETMSQLQHPVGTSYATLYDYLNCLDTSPCWGWMNGNSTVRDLTTQRAQELSGVYSKIISEHNYKNFKMHYIYADIRAEIQKWVAQGGKASDLIEPTDGFHPSQTANLLTTATIWDILSTDFPEALGPINPNNDAIGRMFGNQGGY